MKSILLVDTDRMIHDTIDGETIIIDSVEGRLSVLGGIAPTIWVAATQGADSQRLISEVSDRFGSAASTETLKFINQLVALGLLTLVTGPEGDVELPEWPEKYEQPVVEQFDDIADILTMDPIHEVDVGRGWPRRSA